jgi:8-oxo-dGTP pyrophosphatase MutT (NUDIX family)
LMSLALAGCGEGPAGSVLYHRDGETGEVWVLLADHTKSERGWSAFGGGAEAGETAKETAARETEEETRGYIKRDWLLGEIADQEPVHSGRYRMFFVEVADKVDAAALGVYPLGEKEGEAVMSERGPYAWIPFSVVERALGDSKDEVGKDDLKIERRWLPEGAKTDWFWDVWVGNMRNAREAGGIPWEEQEVFYRREQREGRI